MKHDHPDSEARQSIVREWDQWIKTQPLGGDARARDVRKFFLEIKARRFPTSLDFGSGADDKWELVQQWLVKERRVAD